MGIQRGSLVLADIGGYTRYLTGVELEHSQDILADLMNTLVENLGQAFKLAKLEGDAVFCFDTEESPDGQLLVSVIDATYFAFRRRVRDIASLTTCECNACSALPILDLKFVAHHGEFIVHDVAGRSELVGADVIRVHRLLKNTIELKAYAFLTEASIDRCKLDPQDIGLARHTEKYEDVGEVKGWLIDLEKRFGEDEERRSVRVSDEEAHGTIVGDLPAPPAAVWDTLTTPRKQFLWFEGLERYDETFANGLRGVGTTAHCVHGGMTVANEIMDWKPFRYWTVRSQTPMGRLLSTYTTTTNDDGSTHLVFTMKLLDDPPPEVIEQARAMLTEWMNGNIASVHRVLTEGATVA